MALSIRSLIEVVTNEPPPRINILGLLYLIETSAFPMKKIDCETLIITGAMPRRLLQQSPVVQDNDRPSDVVGDHID